MVGQITFTFGMNELNIVRSDAKAFLESNLDDQTAFFMNVAINEAVNNSLIHGKSTTITMTITFKENQLVVGIQDDGMYFNGNEQIRQIRQSDINLFEENLYDEGKRGLLILEKVCDDVRYDEGKNQLKLIKNIQNKRIV